MARDIKDVLRGFKTVKIGVPEEEKFKGLKIIFEEIIIGNFY